MKLTGQQYAERRAQEADAIVGEDIDKAAPDAPVLPECDALDGEGGESGKGAEEADDQQQPQLGRQGKIVGTGRHQEAGQQTAGGIDGQRAIGEGKPQLPCQPQADKVAGIRAQHCAQTDPKYVRHMSARLRAHCRPSFMRSQRANIPGSMKVTQSQALSLPAAGSQSAQSIPCTAGRRPAG